MTQTDELILSVLDLQPNLTHKKGLRLLPLSLYSSELKNYQHISKLVAKINSGLPIDAKVATAKRYHNTLAASGLVEGPYDSPTLTAGANIYIDLYEKYDATAVNYWRDNGESIEYHQCRYMLQRALDGHVVPSLFREAWRNVAHLCENVSENIFDALLDDLDQLLFAFSINSVGWEYPRFCRLDSANQAKFLNYFNSLSPTPNANDSAAIQTARAYRKAWGNYQQDIRYRIQAFAKAFKNLSQEFPASFALFDAKHVQRQLSPAALPSPPDQTHNEIDLPRQLIVTGCPGSGKSFYLNDVLSRTTARVLRTQFHAETSSFDFVGSYKPYPIYREPTEDEPTFVDSQQKPHTTGTPYIDYRFVPGPLVQALVLAYNNPTLNVVLVIEEINRGNAAAIFGEFFQLLDRTSTGESMYAATVPADLQSYLGTEGVIGDATHIRFPSNLLIWGTMNAADQGVYPLDSAFRRRWTFRYKSYNETCKYAETDREIFYNDEMHDWEYFRAQVNQKLLERDVHEDKLVGPYFLSIEELKDPLSVLDKLFFYLWDDVFRFRQGELFHDRSFTGVCATWNAGLGNPLKIVLNAKKTEQSGTTEPDGNYTSAQSDFSPPSTTTTTTTSL